MKRKQALLLSLVLAWAVGARGGVGFGVTGAAKSTREKLDDERASSPDVVPLAPADLSATGVGTTRVDLRWTDRARNETGFRVERKAGDGSYVEIASLPADATSHSDMGVSGSTAYAYRVVAYNLRGDSKNSNEAVLGSLSGSSTFGSLAQVGFCPLPAGAKSVVVQGNYAYVLSGSAGLRIIDVSDKAAPRLVGSHDLPDTARGLFVSGNYAYVAASGAGLQIINVSAPGTPVFAGKYDPSLPTRPENAYDVHVVGDTAYVADAHPQSGLLVINVQNRASPSLIGSTATASTETTLYVEGGVAYVGYGLYAVDVAADPANPVIKGSYGTTETSDIFVSGGYAYLAKGPSGLAIVDVSNPSSLVFKGSLPTNGTYNGVFVSDGYAYVAETSYGLRRVDIRNPAQPVLAGGFASSTGAQGVSVDGDYVYIADSGAGLRILTK
jgi:hypothetical protein